MSKLTLSDVVNLEDQTTAIATINANNDLIENALEITLSRDGTSPNTMVTDFDMNSNRILNLPAASSDTEPVRLAEVGNAPALAAAAAASAVTAAAQAVIATTQASTSTTQAAVSTASAVTSTAQAVIATTQATNAATSATNSATSATQAANSVSAIKWNFESSTSMAAPASGGFRLNNATPASVTAVAINATDADGNSASAVVNTWDDSTTTAHRGVLKVRKLSSSTTYALYDLTAAVTDNSTWLQLTLTYISGAGTFSAADACDMTFVRTGDAGAGTISGMSNHGIPVASGASAITSSIALTDGQLVVGQTSADPLPKSLTGDITLAASGATAVAKIAGVTVSGTTGTVNNVFSTSPTLVTPVLGAATATSINKMAITAPASSSTLAVADGKTFTSSNTLTLAGTDSTTMTFPGVSSNIGYLEIPQNSKSAAYTTVLTDSGKHVYHPGADTTARTFTIDSNANVAYPIGATLTFINDTSAGTLTIAITSDTLVMMGTGSTGSRTLVANGIATATKVTSTRWVISGIGLS